MKYDKIQYGSFQKIATDYKYDLKAKLIVLTSINPTSNGEGKTTTLIGLTDLLNHYDKKTIGCLRQPSVGPFLGMKGGATGSGQCILKNDFEINIGLTGDFDKISLVNNLIVTIIENEIYFNSDLRIDQTRIHITRCLDLNDRSLRKVNYIIKDNKNYETSFSITAASNLMAAFCLVNNVNEFSTIIEKTIVAFSLDDKPITIGDLKIVTNIVKILETAFLPNIVKTQYESLILMHGGPFANIAHGCNTIIATKTAMTNADFVLTESGFGSDLGLEKFINIKCQRANIFPNLVIYAISLKSIIEHGNGEIIDGMVNLKQHLAIAKSFGIKPIVILNQFQDDKLVDIEKFINYCSNLKIPMEVSNLWKLGPTHKSQKKLLDFILENLNHNPEPKFTYQMKDTILDKITKVAKTIYGATKIEITETVLDQIKNLKNGENNFNICIAKNQKSIIGHNLNNNVFYITDFKINYFAKLIILITSKVFLMPGLPKVPNIMKEL